MKHFKITYWLVIALGLVWTIPFVNSLAHPTTTAIEVGQQALENTPTNIGDYVELYHQITQTGTRG